MTLIELSFITLNCNDKLKTYHLMIQINLLIPSINKPSVPFNSNEKMRRMRDILRPGLNTTCVVFFIHANIYIYIHSYIHIFVYICCETGKQAVHGLAHVYTLYIYVYTLYIHVYTLYMCIHRFCHVPCMITTTIFNLFMMHMYVYIC